MQDVYQLKQPASQHHNRVGNTHPDMLARPYYLITTTQLPPRTKPYSSQFICCMQGAVKVLAMFPTALAPLPPGCASGHSTTLEWYSVMADESQQ